MEFPFQMHFSTNTNTKNESISFRNYSNVNNYFHKFERITLTIRNALS